MHDPVVTPEAVVLDLQPATVGSRTVAILLDYLLIAGGLLLLAAAEAALGLSGLLPGWLGVALVLLLVFALQFGYPVAFETLWRGRTPGKAAMGLRVLTLEGAPVRLRHAAVRAAVGTLELLGTLGAIAVVASFVSSRGQRLGDLAAGTLVVRERRAGGEVRSVRFDPPVGLEPYVRVLDVSRLDATDYATVRDVLIRRLDPATRESLARRVATALAPRVRPPPPGGVGAVPWLTAVAAAVQARGRGPQSGPPPPPPPRGPGVASGGPVGEGAVDADEGPGAAPDDDRGGFRPPS